MDDKLIKAIADDIERQPKENQIGTIIISHATLDEIALLKAELALRNITEVDIITPEQAANKANFKKEQSIPFKLEPILLNVYPYVSPDRIGESKENKRNRERFHSSKNRKFGR